MSHIKYDRHGMIDMTVGEYLAAAARANPDHPAVKYTDRDYERTYKQFDEECDRVAKGLLSMGIKKGDHVAIWATNYPEWLLTLFSTAKIGAVLVTVNTAYKVFEAEYLLRQSDTKALVMIGGYKDSNYVDIMNEICPELASSAPGELKSRRLPFLKHVIFVGEDTPAGMYNFRDLFTMAKKISNAELRAAKAALSPHDVTNMQYTSGTTGFPKGVMLTHYNILNNGRSIGDAMKFTPDDRLCICVPFFHCFGLVLAVMASLTHTVSMVPVDYYRPKKVMDAIESEGCTAVHGVPTMFIGMLEHPDFDKYTFKNMRTGIMAGSVCPEKVMRDVVEKMHMRHITSVYGQTESSPGCTQTTTDDPLELRVTTVGRRYSNVETKIVDPETGRELGPGEVGEFVTRGYHVMKGYYKMPEATAQAIDRDGWLHTGDLAAVDENGYYRITGRLRDMIIRGGENIYPKEIEDFLYTNPKISDVQVVGVPSEQYGEEICACIILKEGETLTEDEVKAFVNKSMAKHKTPSYVLFMDTFPMTASGKIQKFRLKDRAAELLGLSDKTHTHTA